MLIAVLAAVVATAQVPVASTYDDAACADVQEKAPPGDDGVNCSEPPQQPVPAVLDCNDARMSLYLGDMIGSCDMPRPQAGPSLRVPAADQRLCNDGHCGIETVPHESVVRGLDELRPIAGATRLPLPHFTAVRVDSEVTIAPSQIGGDRLERPPRSR